MPHWQWKSISATTSFCFTFPLRTAPFSLDSCEVTRLPHNIDAALFRNRPCRLFLSLRAHKRVKSSWFVNCNDDKKRPERRTAARNRSTFPWFPLKGNSRRISVSLISKISPSSPWGSNGTPLEHCRLLKESPLENSNHTRYRVAGRKKKVFFATFNRNYSMNLNRELKIFRLSLVAWEFYLCRENNS